MLAGITDILIITTPHHQPLFREQLNDGSQWGITISYAVQSKPDGLARAFVIGRDFIGNDPCALILGDNIFYGDRLTAELQDGLNQGTGATIFAYSVKNPEEYGVVEFDKSGGVISLEEKPVKPRSNYAVPGLYLYDNQVVDFARHLQPSIRGELEITDLNRMYLKKKQLSVERLGRDWVWFDIGSHQSLIQAANFVQTVQERQGRKICCPEEIAYRMRLIDAEQVLKQADPIKMTCYGRYLIDIVQGGTL